MLNLCVKFTKPFTVEPEVILFTNYERGQTYVRKVTIRSTDSLLSQEVTINFNATAEVHLNGVNGPQRLISGQELAFEVVFTPSRRYRCQKQDRTYEVEIVSELRGKYQYKFLLPVIALSPYPSLTFPKELVVPGTCPIVPTFVSMYLCNNSNLIQRFTLSFPKEIIIKPKKKSFSIPQGNHETLLIQANPLINAEMQLTMFDTGKQHPITIKSVEQKCRDVYLKDTFMNFADTYLGQKSSRTTEIVNNSDSTVVFEFSGVESQVESPEGGDHICSQPKSTMIPFTNKYFDIVPSSGEVGPNSSMAIEVTFNPPATVASAEIIGSSTFIEQTVLLEFTSSSNIQTEVQLSGVMLGPKIKFDTYEVRLKSFHCGETVGFDLKCCNEGPLDGEVSFQEIESRFGGEVNVDPLNLLLKPNDHGTFHVTYFTCNIGRFVEKLKFIVVSGDVQYITITGKVEPLTVDVTPEVIDFGQVSICCRQFHCIRVKNVLTCPIKLDFELENQDQKKIDALLSFDEYEAKEPMKMVQFNFPEAPTNSLASFVSSQDEFSEVLEKLLEEYEHVKEGASSEKLHASIQSSVEAVKSILGHVFCKLDHYLDIEDYRQNLESTIHQMIDDWIEHNQLVDRVLDDVLCELVENYETSHGKQIQTFTPFFEKDWCLCENTQEYEVGLNGTLPLQPHEMETIRLNLVPNWPGVFRTRLKVLVSLKDDLANDQTCCNIIWFPLMHNCIIPELVLAHTDVIELDLYVGQTATNIIRIRNLDEKIDGFICAPEYTSNDLQIKSTPEKEIIPKDTEVNFKVTVTPFVIGKLGHTYQMHILGSDKPVSISFRLWIKPVRIKVDPKVVVTEDVKPGEVKVATFILMNLSPVQLGYQLRMGPHSNLGECSIESYDPWLLPYDIVEIGIRQCFDTPGVYEASCFIDISEEYGKPQEVKLRTHVIGVPLKVLPEVEDNVLDLGMIVYDKKPFPTLEFQVENLGQIKYFLVPKMLYDEDLKVDDTRIEIQPGEIQTFTVDVCPKAPKRINNTLFFNGSSTGMSKDYETFKMINFKGKFIKRTVYFSANDVTLELKYDDDVDQKGHATIHLVNDSLVYLLVHCTINGDYELIDAENCQIGTFLDIELASKERRELTIQFNTLLIGQGSTSQRYSAKLKAFVDGKLQAVSDVTTIVRYPTIEVDETEIQVYQTQHECFTSFAIQNSETIDAHYRWELVEESLRFESINKGSSDARTRSVIDAILSSDSCQDISLVENFMEELKSMEVESDVELLEDPSEEEEEPSEVGNQSGKRRKSSKKVSIFTGDSGHLNEQSSKEKKAKKKADKKEQSSPPVPSDAVSLSSSKKRKSKKGGKVKDIPDVETSIEAVELDLSTIDITENELQDGLSQFWNPTSFPVSNDPDQTHDPTSSETILKHLVHVSPPFGTLQSSSCQHVSLLFKANSCPCKYSFMLRLDIEHGCSKTIQVCVVNDQVHLDLNKDLLDFGTQPWYSLARSSFEITTRSQLPIHVKYLMNHEGTNKLLNGKLLLSEQRVKLSNNYYRKHSTKVMAYMGFEPYFTTTIGIEANHREPILLKIQGAVQIPNITFIGCPMKESTSVEVESDYLALRKMFNESEIQPRKGSKHVSEPIRKALLLVPANSEVSVKRIEQEKIGKADEEHDRTLSLNLEDCLIRLTTDSIVMKVIEDQKPPDYLDKAELDEMSYEVLDVHPGRDFPHFWQIKNFLEQSRLVLRSATSSEVASHMETLSNVHIFPKFNVSNMKSPPKYIFTGKPTNFPIDPIPSWCLPIQSYSLDLGPIKLNELHKASFEFVCHGPGVFNASVRSESPIPGLSIRFSAPPPDATSTSNEIPFKFTLKEYQPEPPKGPRPPYELAHAHSYDFTKRLVHVRKGLNVEEKAKVKEHYSHVSVMHGKLRVRDPNTYAEIFQETSKDATGLIFGLMVEFHPTPSAYGKKFSDFHEVLHLDIHLGPSVPLYLYAKIVPRDSSCGCQKKVKFAPEADPCQENP